MTVPLDVMNDIRSMDGGGVPRAEIARRLGVSRNTVAKYADMEDSRGGARGDAPRGGREVVRAGYAETLTYTGFPREHRARIRTNNAIERLNREVRRRTRVVGTFPDGKSALMLVTARLKYVAESEWGSRRYLDVTLLEE